MNYYELFIKCKACREGNHCDCSGGKKGEDNIVQIRCSCSDCKKKENAIEEDERICDDIGRYNKNGLALVEVEGPVANADQKIEPPSPFKEVRQR